MWPQIIFKTVLIISVSTANSPPLVNFGPSTGRVVVQENFKIGDVLFNITASDPDNQPLYFSIVNAETTSLVNLSQPNQTNNVWKVDVLLKTQLDRDRSPDTRTLVFSVTDGQLPLQGRVSLIITDVNDNPPMFTRLPYMIRLPENLDVNETVFVATAEDVDDTNGGELVFSMTAQGQGITDEYNTTFLFENETFGHIKLARLLDYEMNAYYQFLLFAKDRGSPPCPGYTCLCSNITEPSVNCAGDTAIFSVIVIDVQDTPPFFTGLPYLASVYENATLDTSIFQVTALDGDRRIPNVVIFSIVNASNQLFLINSTSGVITVDSTLDADLPFGQQYTLNIMATEVDKPGQIQFGEINQVTKVFITVFDVNDNVPEFTREHYTASMKNSTPRGVPLTLSGILEVTDRDQGENSYFILWVEKNGYPYPAFEIFHPTGVVRGTTTIAIRVNDSSLIGQEGNNPFNFQIVARETDTLELFEARANIIVTIEDEHWWNTCNNNVLDLVTKL